MDFESASLVYIEFRVTLTSDENADFQMHLNKIQKDSFSRLHVKIPENYFKILVEGKNVGKFIFRRNVKIPENEPRTRKNPGIFFGNNV